MRGRDLVLLASVAACGGATTTPVKPQAENMVSFRQDVAFLRKHGEVIVLSDARGGRVALSAAYQGRVMSSAVGEDTRSLGWINRGFIESGKTGTPFDNYGGEDRFWLGPEGGQFGLYFPPGAPFSFDAWQTPHEMQEGAWATSDVSDHGATFKRSMHVTNWSKTTFTVDVERTVHLLSRDDAASAFGFPTNLLDHVGFVGFESVNVIKNAGSAPWVEATGLPSTWILAMFAPVADTRVVIPFAGGASGSPIVNDAYFGKVPADRLDVREKDGFLVFRCDGKYRSKIGLGPARAKGALGSYSAEAKLLTVVQYRNEKSKDHLRKYVNSMWEQQKDPYGGDVVNSYNDGPPAPGKPPLGGFYELETSSPAAPLAPNETLAHAHRTFHFVGDPDVLEPIAKHALGVSLASVVR